MKTIFNIVLFLLFSSGFINSQVTLEWARRYNGPINDYDAANAIAVDDSGYVYVTGGSRSNTGFDYATIKYTSTGNLVWLRRHNGIENGDDIGRDIILDNSGNVYVTGVSTIKYNSNGDSIWGRRFIGIGSGGVKLVLNSNNDVYVGGININDYALIKYDNNGNIIWTRFYNGPAGYTDRISDIVLDRFGNIIVTGESEGIGTDYDYATIKYDSSGNQLWVRRYNGLASNIPTDIARALTVDDSANVYVTGWSQGTDEDWDCVTIKYKPNGDTAWIQRFIGSTATGDDITLDGANNVYVTGYFQGNYILIKSNSNGNILWQRTTPSPGGFFIPVSHVITDTLNNVYLCATKRISSQILNNLIIKFDSAGNTLWTVEYNGGAPEEADYSNAIFADKNLNIYATGTRATGTVLYDYQTLKYSQITGVKPISNEIPEDYELFQNYPNPFNPVTHFEFRISDFGFVKLTIYDILGREVTTLVNEKLKPGTYEITFDAYILPSGVYFYTLHANDFKKTCKMVLIK